MGDQISDQELRRRLLAFNAVVPPVTGSTRKLLLKKLADLEGSQANKNAATKSMPPPKPKSKASTNGTTNESIMISSSMGSKPSQYIQFDNTDSPRKSTRRQRQYRAPDPFDTGSDSEIDTGTIGRSTNPGSPYIASSSPKSIERSLMNVSTWDSTGVDEDKISYLSPGKLIKF